MNRAQLQSAIARRPVVIVILLAAWCVALVPGFRYLLAYERTPGTQSAAPRSWPAGIALTRSPTTPTLIVAMHPRCTCTRATLTELEAFAAEPHPAVTTTLLIYQPESTQEPNAWRDLSIYAAAQKSLNAKIVLDPGGRLAEKFGAETSGEALLYAADGTLRYQGGVTGARGMQGNNAGLTTLRAALAQPTSSQPLSKPVFGCALFAHSTSTPQGTR